MCKVVKNIIQRGWLVCTCLVLALSVLWACTSLEETAEEGVLTGQPMEVTVRVNTQGLTSSLEDCIRELRIYAFRQGKLVEHYYHKYPGTSDMREVVMKIPSDVITFYVIANESEAGPLKKHNQTDFVLPTPDAAGVQAMTLQPTDLDSLTFSQLPEAVLLSEGTDPMDEATNTYDPAILPMAGKIVARISSNNQYVNLALKHSVAKMTLHFSKSGAGELYMGRGLYLYNDPQYGYLFPRTLEALKKEPLATFISRKEDTERPQPPYDAFHSDSYLHQRNGRVLLRCGWPTETEKDSLATPPQQLHINQIHGNVNGATPSYDQIPPKAFYLFANPYRTTPTVDHLTRPDLLENGYYLKIIAHEHLHKGQQVIHRKERFYVCLPEVEANDHIEVRSVFTLDGHVSFYANWAVKEWVSGGGNITFE